MGGRFQLHCSAHEAKLSGLTEEQTLQLSCFTMLPTATKTSEVLKGRADALSETQMTSH